MAKNRKYPMNGEAQAIRIDPKTKQQRAVILTFKDGKCVGKKWAAPQKGGRHKVVPIAGPPAN